MITGAELCDEGRRMNGKWWLSWGVVLVLAAAAEAQTVTFSSLLNEMVDREKLARFPVDNYRCSQASSYDRGTVAPDQPGWFANMDRSHFVRIEQQEGRKEYVLMDEDGPGAVVRFWATWQGPRGKPFSNGTLRFYLDHNPQPVIEGPIASILDGGALCAEPLSEGVSPQTEPAYRGHNLYLPIPYSRHCKVTCQTDAPIDAGAYKGEGIYYQINYRTYPNNVQVKTFSMSQLAACKNQLDDVQRRLAASGIDNQDQLDAMDFSGPLKPGETRTLTIRRQGAVRKITIDVQADDQPQALQSTVLAIEFDGESTVWCPVGTFFGRGYQSKPHRTWYTEVRDDGRMSAFWVMPFEKECKLSLINLSEQTVDIRKGDVFVGEWEWDDRSMHFHAGWKQLTKVSSFRAGADEPGKGAFDVNFVEIAGRGVYVGDTLAVFNGTDAWWGEGDEKIYVDGETFPSHIGTGTEDYYGYAWCRPEFFQSPFHAQPSGEGNLTAGYTVNSRYRALDAIPFEKSLKFDMELWHWRKTTLNYAPAVFWYGRPGATDNLRPDPVAAAQPVALKRSDVVEVFVAKGALEGEDLKQVSVDGGVVETQAGLDLRWSDDAQLWWRDAKVGDRLVLEFPVEEAGRYEVAANLTKAVDYAKVEIAINDNVPIEFDGYNTKVTHKKIELGEFDLSKGSNRLTVKIVGANDAAIKRYMFGLDYLQLIQKGPSQRTP